ncbi:hypothetical protein M565_ctg1P0890 [Vibrio cyclitrophicus FF75]|nr:hypothetical protein M565_ctg1P0890 [Vibrio cyclitrophicus FF75]
MALISKNSADTENRAGIFRIHANVAARKATKQMSRLDDMT